MKFYILDSAEVSGQETENILCNFPEQKKNEICRIQDCNIKKERILSYSLAVFSAAKELHLSPGEVLFEKDCYGKPFLKGLPDYHFSISHSRGLVGCVSAEYSVGLDIEYNGPADDAAAAEVFSVEELKILSGLKDKEKDRYFYILWTLKESYFKALGEGLSAETKKYSMHAEGSTVAAKSGNNIYTGKMFYRRYNIFPEYSITVCCAGNEFPENPEILLLQDLSLTGRLLDLKKSGILIN